MLDHGDQKLSHVLGAKFGLQQIHLFKQDQRIGVGGRSFEGEGDRRSRGGDMQKNFSNVKHEFGEQRAHKEPCRAP